MSPIKNPFTMLAFNKKSGSVYKYNSILNNISMNHIAKNYWQILFLLSLHQVTLLTQLQISVQ